MPKNTGVRRRKEIGRQKFPGAESLSSYYEPVYTHFDVCAVFNVLSSALPGVEQKRTRNEAPFQMIAISRFTCSGGNVVLAANQTARIVPSRYVTEPNVAR
jgi:hypothetical protein